MIHPPGVNFDDHQAVRHRARLHRQFELPFRASQSVWSGNTQASTVKPILMVTCQ